MNHRLGITLALIHSAVVLASAQPAPDSAARHEAALEFVRVLRLEPTIVRLIGEKLGEAMGGDLELKQKLPAYREFFRKYLSGPALENELALIYGSKFSLDDFRQLTRFYRSALGQKFLDQSPSLEAELVQFGKRIIVDHRSELEALLAQAPAAGAPGADSAGTSEMPADPDTLIRQNFGVMMTNGKQRHSEGRFPEAAQFFEAAVSLQPDNAEAEYFLACTYARLASNDGGTIPQADLAETIRAVDHFRKVIRLQPYYAGEFLELDPYSKITSCWGVMGMAYADRGELDSAKWAFTTGRKAGGYADALLEFNRNIMASCERDAILFVNGDNDTYPMLYLQLVERFRRDITVVNVSLLNAPWFVRQVVHRYPYGGNRLRIGLSDAQIDSLSPTYWTAQEVEVAAPGDPLNPEGRIRWSFEPTGTYEGRGFVRIQDLLVREIVEVNAWKRPIYFSVTVDAVNRINLDAYLSLEGLVSRLLSHAADSPDLEMIRRNTHGKYAFDALRGDGVRNMRDVVHLALNYQSNFILLAAAARERGDTAKAREIFDTMNAMVPPGIFSLDVEGTRRTAYVYNYGGFYPEAIALYRRAIESGMGTSGMYGGLGWSHYLAGEFGECIAASEKAVELEPLAMYARYNIPLAHLRLGNVDRALALYREARAFGDANAPGDGVEGAVNDLRELVKQDIMRAESERILAEVFQVRDGQ